jgi:hypothetical protein
MVESPTPENLLLTRQSESKAALSSENGELMTTQPISNERLPEAQSHAFN